MSSLGLGVPGGGIPILVTRRMLVECKSAEGWELLAGCGSTGLWPHGTPAVEPRGACPQVGVSARAVQWGWGGRGAALWLPVCFLQAPVSSFPSTGVTWT